MKQISEMITTHLIIIKFSKEKTFFGLESKIKNENVEIMKVFS